jgi:hypothetical protein
VLEALVGQFPEHAFRLSVEVLDAMQRAKREVPDQKVRSYVDELEHAPSVIRIPDQILNMDETRLCSRPMKAKKR